MTDGSNDKILRDLGTPSAGAAWQDFLARHTALMLSVIRQHQHQEQRIHDCYIFVCEKLADNRFRRLRSWRRQGKTRFTTWLRAVISNLCVDWHRQEFGRQRPFRSLSELSDLEVRVYRLRFEQGASLSECMQAIAVEYPGVSEMELAGMIRELNRTLTPRQHWILSTHRRIAVSVDDPEVRREASIVEGNGDETAGHAVSEEEKQRLDQAIRQLPTVQRLVLRLRFQQGLTLKETAWAAGLEDEFKARYVVSKALKQLNALLSD
jgi:RNA polymerase sigma factor (sigma-70 family)